MPRMFDRDRCVTLMFTAEMGAVFGLNARTIGEEFLQSLNICIRRLRFALAKSAHTSRLRNFWCFFWFDFDFSIGNCLRSKFWFDAFDSSNSGHVGYYNGI